MRARKIIPIPSSLAITVVAGLRFQQTAETALYTVHRRSAVVAVIEIPLQNSTHARWCSYYFFRLFESSSVLTTSRQRILRFPYYANGPEQRTWVDGGIGSDRPPPPLRGHVICISAYIIIIYNAHSPNNNKNNNDDDYGCVTV